MHNLLELVFVDAAHSNKEVFFIPWNLLLKRHLPRVHVSTGNAVLCVIVMGVATFEPELAIIIGLSIMAFDSFNRNNNNKNV